MFARLKRSGGHEYLQIVRNDRVDGRVRQRVVANLGRLDLQGTGAIEALVKSLARFATPNGESTPGYVPPEIGNPVRVGAPLLFDRLWRDIGIGEVMSALSGSDRFRFSVERAVFLTVLHRLMDPTADRAAEDWAKAYEISGTTGFSLAQLYRAMTWLGQPTPSPIDVQGNPWPRTRKDRIEDLLFARRREAVGHLDLAFFVATALQLDEYAGPDSRRDWGPGRGLGGAPSDLLAGALFSNKGTPLCSQVWPGDVADGRTLAEMVDRLRQRFGIGKLVFVSELGLVNRASAEALRSAGEKVGYILATRLRSQRGFREKVWRLPGRFRDVEGPGGRASSETIRLKDVTLDGTRYVIVIDKDEADRDQSNRAAAVAALQIRLKARRRSLMLGRNFAKYVRLDGMNYEIDREAIKEDARYDGMWALETNLAIDSHDIAHKFVNLRQVQQAIKSVGAVLDERSIYGRREGSIRGQVFCSFLAILLLTELGIRLKAGGDQLDWALLRDELDRLEEFTLDMPQGLVRVRSPLGAETRQAFRAAGIPIS